MSDCIWCSSPIEATYKGKLFCDKSYCHTALPSSGHKKTRPEMGRDGGPLAGSPALHLPGVVAPHTKKTRPPLGRVQIDSGVAARRSATILPRPISGRSCRCSHCVGASVRLSNNSFRTCPLWSGATDSRRSACSTPPPLPRCGPGSGDRR